ncbi:MAG: anaerobic ribonucleoside-triphosphate reductase activating protein [Patescibacteria group bacterium]
MLKIGGLQKITLIDYPGHLAATIFLAGCNFHCGFCHNPGLVEIKPGREFISAQEILDYLCKRKGILEAVCISGGEPLIQPDLKDFLAQIKSLGYLIKLDTNGFNPAFLKELLAQNLIDYIAMDIKASLAKYGEITNVKSDFKNIEESIKIILAGNLPYEFRTTVLPKFHDPKEMAKIGQMITGAKNYYLQNFRNFKTLDPSFAQEQAFTEAELQKLREIALKYVKNCEIRN